MNIIDISFEPAYYISIKLNWLALLVLCAALVGISYLIKKVIPVSRKSFQSQENTPSPSKR